MTRYQQNDGDTRGSDTRGSDTPGGGDRWGGREGTLGGGRGANGAPEGAHTARARDRARERDTHAAGGGRPGAIHVGGDPDGLLTYLVELEPEALPSVGGRALERAWYAAREAALAERPGVVRGFRFRRADGSHTDLALADRDARCWVGAVDRTVGIANTPGLSLCLRLLALIDLLGRAPWARPLCHLARDGAEFHPALLKTAACQPLTADARFDEASFRARLSEFVGGLRIEPAHANTYLSGAH